LKTIKELAAICKVSKTTIERTIKDLGINKQIHGNKYLVSESDSLRICYEITNDPELLQQIENRNTTNETEPEQFTSNATEPQQETATNQNTSIDPTQKLIEILESQLEVNKRTIESLQEQNKILAQTVALQSSQILDLNQKLIGTKEEKRDPVNDIVDPDNNIVYSDPEPAQTIVEPQKKKGFWARLFGL